MKENPSFRVTRPSPTTSTAALLASLSIAGNRSALPIHPSVGYPYRKKISNTTIVHETLRKYTHGLFDTFVLTK